jgi:hypothetical protein
MMLVHSVFYWHYHNFLFIDLDNSYNESEVHSVFYWHYNYFLFIDLDNSHDESDAGPLSDNGEKPVTQTNTFSNPLLNGETASISSIETLLLNIQGLLKVAAENARHHERQLSYEKGRLLSY